MSVTKLSLVFVAWSAMIVLVRSKELSHKMKNFVATYSGVYDNAKQVNGSEFHDHVVFTVIPGIIPSLSSDPVFYVQLTINGLHLIELIDVVKETAYGVFHGDFHKVKRPIFGKPYGKPLNPFNASGYGQVETERMGCDAVYFEHCTTGFHISFQDCFSPKRPRPQLSSVVNCDEWTVQQAKGSHMARYSPVPYALLRRPEQRFNLPFDTTNFVDPCADSVQ